MSARAHSLGSYKAFIISLFNNKNSPEENHCYYYELLHSIIDSIYVCTQKNPIGNSLLGTI